MKLDALAGQFSGDPEQVFKVAYHKPILTGGISFTGAYGEQVHLEPGITFSKTPGHWNVPGHPVVSPRGASNPEWLGY